MRSWKHGSFPSSRPWRGPATAPSATPRRWWRCSGWNGCGAADLDAAARKSDTSVAQLVRCPRRGLMNPSLPTPEVLSRYVDDNAGPALPATALSWGTASGAGSERLWELPEGLSLVAPPPAHFGLKVERIGTDLYRVALLWDRTRLTWPALRRVQLLGSSLPALLQALGSDPAKLLDQPIQRGPFPALASA